jgi:hypothetical protein
MTAPRSIRRAIGGPFARRGLCDRLGGSGLGASLDLPDEPPAALSSVDFEHGFHAVERRDFLGPEGLMAPATRAQIDHEAQGLALPRGEPLDRVAVYHVPYLFTVGDGSRVGGMVRGVRPSYRRPMSKRAPVYVRDVDPADYLTSEDEIADYLRAMFSLGDPELVAWAQAVVERARKRLAA